MTESEDKIKDPSSDLISHEQMTLLACSKKSKKRFLNTQSWVDSSSKKDVPQKDTTEKRCDFYLVYKRKSSKV